MTAEVGSFALALFGVLISGIGTFYGYEDGTRLPAVFFFGFLVLAWAFRPWRH